MTVHFLIMNAFAVGGTVRATFTTAAALARRQDVQIVSVYRMRSGDPALPVPAGVRLRTLTDLRAPALDRLAARRDPAGLLQRWAARRPSRLTSSNDPRYENFSLLTDVGLLRFLASVRDGALIGTRPALNLAIAYLARESVVRVGQEHLNLALHSPALRARMRAGYPRLDLVATLTEDDAKAYRALLGGRTPVERFPNAVPDVGAHRAALDSRVVVAAGRLTAQKGFDRLLPAWAEVSRRHPGWRLRIFGSGEERESLQRQIDELGISGSATLEGFTRALHEEFSRASLYVLSSRFEGFPMVLLEAMGTGLPVVSVDCETGPREIVTDGVDGYVVPEDDMPALARAMGELMGDAARRRAFGAAALETAARYDAGTVGRRWERRLAELSAAKRPDGGTMLAPALRAARAGAASIARRLGGLAV